MRLMTAILGIGLLALSTSANATPTSVPYTEDFTSSTSTCDAAFASSTCPTGWQGEGDDDSLEYVDAGGDAGIKITPGSSTPNGFSMVFEADPTDVYFTQKVTAWTNTGTATLLVRHKYKDSSGVTVGTSTYNHTVSASTTITPFEDTSTIPTTAATVEVLIGAVSPSSSSVEVEVPGTMAEFATAMCLICWFVPEAAGGCDAPDCTPDISCENEEEPVCFCDAGIYPACDEILECSCPEVKLGQ